MFDDILHTHYSLIYSIHNGDDTPQNSQINLAWNSICFGQFICPSSGVYSLHTQQWYMSYRFVDSFRAGPGWDCSSIRPKHVEFHDKMNLWNWCIFWFYCKEGRDIYWRSSSRHLLFGQVLSFLATTWLLVPKPVSDEDREHNSYLCETTLLLTFWCWKYVVSSVIHL